MPRYLAIICIFFGYFGFSQVTNTSNYQNNTQSVEKQILFLDSLKQVTHQKKDLANISYQLGLIHFKKKPNYHLSKKYFKEAFTLNSELGNNKKAINSLRFLGFINKRIHRPDSALFYFNKALKTIEQDDVLLSKTYSNIAKLLDDENNTIEAKKYYRKSIISGKKAKRNLRITYNNLGNLFLKSNLDSAAFYYKKALKIAKENENIQGELMANINISIARLNDSTHVKEAYRSLLTALKIADSIHDEKSEKFAKLYLAQYYTEINNNKAISILNELLSHQSIKQEPDFYIEVLNQISIFHEKNHLYKKALYYRNIHQKNKDSIYTIERTQALEELRTTYEVAEKDSEILLLSKENRITSNKRKTTIIIAFLIVILLLFFMYLLINKIKSQKEEKKRNEQLHEQEVRINKALNLIIGQENEQKRLAKELHDGLGGQLTGIKFLLQNLSKTNINSYKTLLNEHLVTSINNLRYISHDLSSQFLKNDLFVNIIQRLIHNNFIDNSVEVEFSVFPKEAINKLPEHIKLNIYRIIQEGIQNILKHSKANQVSFSLTVIDELSLIIEDNGIGFDSNKMKNGIGLQNINNRVQSLNGEIDIDSSKNGTILNIKIPINEKKNSNS